MFRLLLLMLLTIPIASTAQMYDAEYTKCSESTTIGIVECVSKATKRWDQRLNDSYKALMKRSDTEQQAPLKSAQRQWIKYRDTNCGFYAAGEGNIAQIETAECLRSMTKARACELQYANRGEMQPEPECRAAVITKASPTQSVSTAPPTQTAPPTPSSAPPETMESKIDKINHASNISFLGLYNMTLRSREGYSATIRANVHFEEETNTAGGSAVFGWMEDSNQVVMVTYAKYLPSLTLARTQRELKLTKPLLHANDLPRYMMTCVWETQENKIAPPLRVYAERDDANKSGSDSGSQQSLVVHWATIPAARAQKKFAAHDYCTDISTSGQSQAMPWRDD